MRGELRFLVALVVFAATALTLPTTGAAQSLDELRAAGVVGERYDGLLVLRDASAPAAVRGLVDQVNAKRLAIYGQRAQAQGLPVDQVGRVYSQQIMQKAPAGTWFLTESGQWRQR